MAAARLHQVEAMFDPPAARAIERKPREALEA
jgi:hypothetical protein